MKKKTYIMNKNKNIKDVVGEYFVRVVKNHNFYYSFRKAYEKYSKHQYKLMENPKYGFLGSIEKVFKNAHDEWKSHGRNTSDEYELITFYINQMLHLFLEAGGVDPRRLGMFGQEIFDLSCYHMYGDKYLRDMEIMNQRDGGVRAPKNDKEAWLLGQYMQLRNGGRIDMSFDEFIHHYKDHIEQADFDESDYNDRRAIADEDIFDDDYFDEDEDIPFDADDEMRN